MNRFDEYVSNAELWLITLLEGKTRMEQDQILGEEEKKFGNV